MNSILMYRLNPGKDQSGVIRRGTHAVETAITLPLALLVLFASLDLGLAVIRRNSLSYSARIIGRELAIHGHLASSIHGELGPAQQTFTIDSNSLTQKAMKTIPTMKPEDVTVILSWPDGENEPQDRVQVELHYTHQSFVTGLFQWSQVELAASSVTPIVN